MLKTDLESGNKRISQANCTCRLRNVPGWRYDKVTVRDRALGLLLKDPSLLSSEAQATTSYPGGHNEGFPDTFKQLYKKVYSYILAGDYHVKPDFPTFADGHYEQVLCEAIERSSQENRWVDVVA